jgi:hypothetical protein
MNSLSDWLCNVLLWGAVFSAVGLLYEAFVSRGLIGNVLPSVVGLVLVAVLSVFWPKY